MLTYSFEWKILDFFDKFRCKFFDVFNQYLRGEIDCADEGCYFSTL